MGEAPDSDVFNNQCWGDYVSCRNGVYYIAVVTCREKAELLTNTFTYKSQSGWSCTAILFHTYVALPTLENEKPEDLKGCYIVGARGTPAEQF